MVSRCREIASTHFRQVMGFIWARLLQRPQSSLHDRGYRFEALQLACPRRGLPFSLTGSLTLASVSRSAPFWSAPPGASPATRMHTSVVLFRGDGSDDRICGAIYRWRPLCLAVCYNRRRRSTEKLLRDCSAPLAPLRLPRLASPGLNTAPIMPAFRQAQWFSEAWHCSVTASLFAKS